MQERDIAASYIAELRNLTLESGVKLKRLRDAIENDFINFSDLKPEDRIAELKAHSRSYPCLR
jgi:hypothetical protein